MLFTSSATSRRWRRSAVAAIAGASAAALLLVGCSSGSKPAETTGPSGETTAPAFETIEDGVLTVAILQGAFPRSDLEGDAIRGTWGFLIEEFAKSQGLTVKPFATDIQGSILAVQSGRADVGAVAYYTDARAQVVRFGVQDTYDAQYLALPRDFKYTGPDSVKGLNIGIPPGYAQVANLQEWNGTENVTLIESPAAAIQAVRNGQLDAFYGGNSLLPLISPDDADLQVVAVRAGELGVPEKFTNIPTGPFFSCTNPEIMEAYNAFYEEFSQTEAYKTKFKEIWSQTSIPVDNIPEKMVLTFDVPKNQCP